MDTNNGINPDLLFIDDLVLDRGKREVTRDSKVIKLPRLSSRLLLVLAEKVPNAVSQSELMDLVWPGRMVSPETLTQRIKLLRQNLRDDVQVRKLLHTFTFTM